VSATVRRRLLALVLVVVAAGAGTEMARAVHGGTYTTATGEQVQIVVSDRYPVDEARNQGWAEFLARLVHGEELATVTLHLAPRSELAFLCGPDAIACYDRRDFTIYSAAERFVVDVSPEAAIAHEYGHHIAASRLNAPWAAIDWGTKRWATYVGVCTRVESGELAPGDQNERYALNPGEAFAEVYRVLSERRLGLVETPWEIVDDAFIPDETALARVEQDVIAPWQAATIVKRSGRATQTRAATVKFSTPLDGRFAATVRSATPVQVELLLGGEVGARSTARTAAVRGTVCGTRSASLRIRSTKGTVPYTLTVARP
jgi:hypothetical protein